MRYSIFIISTAVILMIIAFLNIFFDLFKATGFAISSTVQPQRLLKSIDYDILNIFEGRDNLTLLIKLYTNTSNFCINEVKVDNLSKEFYYREVTDGVYEIVIKNSNRYENLYIRFCDGKTINETKI